MAVTAVGESTTTYRVTTCIENIGHGVIFQHSQHWEISGSHGGENEKSYWEVLPCSQILLFDYTAVHPRRL
jgi:hypothetical protein